MRLMTPPTGASWNHRGARIGFEVTFFAELSGGHHLTGHTTAHESSALWSVGYDLTVDRTWRTTAVHASNLTAAGRKELAAFIRADDLRVERLGQRYTLIDVAPEHILFHYESSTFESPATCDTTVQGSSSSTRGSRTGRRKRRRAR